MILVVGLGNPGERYAETRHNVGFRVLDHAARVFGASTFRERFFGLYADAELCGERLALLKPLTFMNESGRAVGAAAGFFKLEARALVLVHDELDLPFGELRLKAGGGEAGHRGLRSVSGALGDPSYLRLRFGIGRPGPEFGGGIAEFVLEGFSSAERAELDTLLDRAAEAIRHVVCDGLDRAMSQTHQRIPR